MILVWYALNDFRFHFISPSRFDLFRYYAIIASNVALFHFLIA
jgi:hypothetical protein